jgi:hypothetical protein
MIVERAQRGKRFWSQMVVDGKSDFSEYGLSGFFRESQVMLSRYFAVLTNREIELIEK